MGHGPDGRIPLTREVPGDGWPTRGICAMHAHRAAALADSRLIACEPLSAVAAGTGSDRASVPGDEASPPCVVWRMRMVIPGSPRWPQAPSRQVAEVPINSRAQERPFGEHARLRRRPAAHNSRALGPQRCRAERSARGLRAFHQGIRRRHGPDPPRCDDHALQRGSASGCPLHREPRRVDPEGDGGHNMLRAFPFELVTHAVGEVASAGNMPFLAGDVRYAGPHVTFMLHPGSFSVKDAERDANSMREDRQTRRSR